MSVDHTDRTGEGLSDLVFRLYPNAACVYEGGSLTVDLPDEKARNYR